MPVVDKITKILLDAKGFDRYFHSIRILAAGNGEIKAEMKVTSEHINPLGTLHGGSIAYLVDVISSLGLFSHERGYKPAVSANININYLSSSREGDTVEILANTLKIGKTTAILQIQLKNQETGVTLAKGSNTMFLLD
ncbi:hypothetical protein AMK59_1390 [Oryctes borbonicus]|uniref:Acyl-coenzyme A thioesterase 13 n=1 Tax=Oryctes borbonicus TaxID=1629725 RepID=A0A0T6BEN8_9SCAR|nr:hypothetical protein AMK59_1390 [Oryctes borbonicus]